MSHFYATIPLSTRKTVPTARGHKLNGIAVQAASWAGSIYVDLWHDEETGKDYFAVYQEKWRGHGICEKLCSGTVGEKKEHNARS